MYKPAQHWLWDFWFVAEGSYQHVFYLQAPDQLADAEMRHPVARIGHARSRDLRHWEELGEVFGPAAAPSWDDRCTWTGSILRLPQTVPSSALQGSRYAMLYTGTNHIEGSAIQRLGLAWSADLQHWQRHSSSPVLVHPGGCLPGPTYLGTNTHHGGEQAWRDPHLSFDPQRGVYQALVTAQLADQEHGHGAIALCESSDLVHWQAHPALFASRAFFLMEIPQHWFWGEYEYLLFSAIADWVQPQYMDDQFKSFQATTGTYYVFRSSRTHAWQHGGLLWGQDNAMQFGFKLVNHHGQCWGLYWQGYDAQGRFQGYLSDPYPVGQTPDGRLHVDTGAV